MSWYTKHIEQTERNEGEADFGAIVNQPTTPTGPSKKEWAVVGYIVGAGALAVVGSIVSTARGKW